LVEVWLKHAERVGVGKSPWDAGGRSYPSPFDLVLAAMALLAATPIMLLVAGCIWLEDGGPVFFVQKRVGHGGRIFPCLKFRSMSLNADASLNALLSRDPSARAEWISKRKLRNDPRVTFVGRLIRRGSLDELPQLFNVLLGHMSLVGPRPIMVDEIKLYGARLRHYCTVRPGLTGLWQVSGRGDASFRSRVAMDMVYIRSQGVALNLWIVAATIPAVIFGRGSY
jgi:exopolysaccharide production protein ExoY